MRPHSTPPRPRNAEWASFFWSYVDRSAGFFACWPWIRSRTVTGYGEFGLNGRVHRAHRLAWELTHGPIPAGLCCLHTCDMPACCNPAHLFLGTQADNVADMMAKGRGRTVHGNDHWWHKKPLRGEDSSHAKLTAAQVRDIRARRAAGERLSVLAAEFGVTHTNIAAIALRQTWKHSD